MRMRSAWLPGRYGFTLLETIVVVAVVGVLGGLAAYAFRTPTSAVFANSVRSLLLQARFEAVKENVPVVVGWSESARRFEVRRANLSGSGWCENLVGAPISVADPADFGRLEVQTDIVASTEFDESGAPVLLLGQLVWIPSGQARTCQNGLYGDVFTFITDEGRTAAVEVSFGGRVEVR